MNHRVCKVKMVSRNKELYSTCMCKVYRREGKSPSKQFAVYSRECLSKTNKAPQTSISFGSINITSSSTSSSCLCLGGHLGLYFDMGIFILRSIQSNYILSFPCKNKPRVGWTQLQELHHKGKLFTPH